jgi:hypothetical protein
MVHFALILVKISINFSPSYSTFFPITVDVSTLQKFQKLINKTIAYSITVVHSTVLT